jgi:hypothetical protein
MKYWQISLVILATLSASLALAEDFKTINGKEYKNATVSRVEPDGIVLITKSGVSKVYFTELPKDVQERFHYDSAAFQKREESREKQAEQKTATTDNSPPTASEESSPVVIREVPQTPSQLDDAQFDDLRRRDWYEDLKAQEKLKNHADYMLSLMDSMEKNVSDCTNCGDTYRRMLAAERKAHRDNYRALSAIAAKIAATKSYDDYKELKTTEDRVLGAIETQKIQDRNDVMELRMHVSQLAAELLENEQLYQ